MGRGADELSLRKQKYHIRTIDASRILKSLLFSPSPGLSHRWSERGASSALPAHDARSLALSPSCAAAALKKFQAQNVRVAVLLLGQFYEA